MTNYVFHSSVLSRRCIQFTGNALTDVLAEAERWLKENEVDVLDITYTRLDEARCVRLYFVDVPRVTPVNATYAEVISTLVGVEEKDAVPAL